MSGELARRAQQPYQLEAKRGSGRWGASGALGGSHHLAGELFEQNAKLDMVHVAYKGGAPATNDLIAGNVDLMFEWIYAVMPYLKGDSPKLRPLAITSDKRSPLLPDVPTFKELGVPGMEMSNWFGVVAPKVHACRGDRKAQLGGQQGDPGAGRGGEDHVAGQRGGRRHAGGVRGLHPGRVGPLVEAGQDAQHQARVGHRANCPVVHEADDMNLHPSSPLRFRRFGVLAVTAALAVLTAPVRGTAQPVAAAYPAQPIRVIVPFAVGGPNDVMARVLGHRLSQETGQPVVIDNKAGAGGVIGTDAVAKSKPDGYTIGFVSAPFAMVPALQARMPYDTIKDSHPSSGCLGRI